MVSTQDYLTAIQNAKANGTAINNVDPSQWPDSVDHQTVVGALIDGLPDSHANAINARLMSGQPIKQIDFGNIPGNTFKGSQLPGGSNSDPMAGSIYQDNPKTRFLMRNIVRPAMEMTGQAIGGIGGAALGTPEAPGIGTAALGVAGATAGGTAADEIANKIDQEVGISHPEWQAPASIGKRLTQEALGNAAMDVTGRTVGGFIKGVGSPLSDSVNPEVQSAAQDLQVPLTASQQSNSKLLAQSEQMAAKLPGSSGILGDFYAKTRARMMDVVNSLFGQQMNPQIAAQVGDQVNQQLQSKVNELGQTGITPQLDPADVGQSISNDISDFSKDARDYTNGLRSDLAKSVPQGTTVPLTKTAQQASKIAAQHQTLPPALQDQKLLSVLQDLSGGNVPSGASLAPNASPEEQALLSAAIAKQYPEIGVPSKSIPDILNLRSALGQAAAQHEAAFGTNQPGAKFMGDSTSGAYKSLVGSLDDDLDVYSKTADKTFALKYGQVRGVEKSMYDTMANPYIRGILSTDQPEKIVDMAVRKGDTSNLSLLQGMLSSDSRDQLGNAFQNKLIENSQNADGQFLPQKLSQQIQQYGEPTVAQAIGPDGLDNLKKLSTLSDGTFSDPDFRNFISQLGRKNGENVSGMLMSASPQTINRVRALIGEQSFSEAQDGMIHNLLTNNQDNVDFGGLSKRMSDIPPQSLLTALPPEKVATLQKLATIGGGIKASQREFMNPSGTAPMMGMFYILRNLFTNPINAVKVLGGLATGTEAYTTPTATKWLTNGFPGAGIASDIGNQASRIPAALIKQKMEDPYGKKQ